MSLYRRVSVRMWVDGRFRELTPAPPNPQTLWIYLLTGEYTTAIPGVVRGGEAAIAESLGWTAPAFRKAFQEIYAKGMAKPDWAARLVFLPKALKHNPPQSPKVVVAWAKAFEELPECSLKVEIYRTIKDYLEGLTISFRKVFQEAFPEAVSIAIPISESEAEAETELPARKARSRVQVTKEVEDWYDNEFLPNYPGLNAQTQRAIALREAAKLTPAERELSITNLKLWTQSSKWRKDDFSYVPGPGTFFKNKQHLNPPSTMVNGTGRTKIPDARQILQQQQREAIG